MKTEFGVFLAYIQVKIMLLNDSFMIFLKFMQGSFIVRKSNCVIVTIHDIGCSYQNLHKFCSHPSMTHVTERSCYVHICLPGQEPGAEAIETDYPGIQVKFIKSCSIVIKLAFI